MMLLLLPFAAAALLTGADAMMLAGMEVEVDASGRPKRRTSAMLAQLQAYSDKKERLGLVPTEMAAAEEVKAVLTNHILPAILEGADDRQQELDELYHDILMCQFTATTRLQEVVELESEVQKWTENLTTCVHQETLLIGEREKICQEYIEMKKRLVQPALPTISAPNQDIEDYLKEANDAWCGTYEYYAEKYELCKTTQENVTKVELVCTTTQKEFEKAICRARIEREHTCEDYDQCYNDAVAKYNKKVAEIEGHIDSLLEEYRAASKILCLWDAWQLSCSPCTVDTVRVQKCWEEKVNITPVNASFEPVPPPVDCSLMQPGTESDDVPCTDTFIQNHYGAWMLEDEVLSRMKTQCSKCFGFEGNFTTYAPRTVEVNVYATETSSTTTTTPHAVFLYADKKCPFEHGDRLYRLEDQTLESCFQTCRDTPGCQHLSFAEAGTFAGVCMGCLRGLWETHLGFTAYDLPMGIQEGNHLYEYIEEDRMCRNPLFEFTGTPTAACYEKCRDAEGCDFFSSAPTGDDAGTCTGCAADSTFVYANDHFMYHIVNITRTVVG